MNITLIHNSKAGNTSPGGKKLTRRLEDLGHRVNYQASREKRFAEALKEPGDLVVVAGGDGTVNKVARHLVGTGVPLAIIPIGTANNIANALGITGKPKAVIAGLESARPVEIDVGLIRGPWGESRFFEGVGVGLFTEVMCLEQSKSDKGPRASRHRRDFVRELRFLRRALTHFPPLEWTVTLDGEDASGDYLLCEVMNTNSIGPRLSLAPNAVPTDGLLDVVLVDEEQRDRLHDYLIDRLMDKAIPPDLKIRRVRRAQISIGGAAVRIDDRIKRAGIGAERRSPDGNQPATMVEIGLDAQSLKVLVPRSSA